MKLIYLAGPITGLNYKGCTDWRKEVSKDFDKTESIRCISPMRGKEFLENYGIIKATGYNDTLLASDQAITNRDRFDCKRSDIIIMNFAGAESKSIGSCIELGWADAYRVPVIVVMDDLHDHCIVRGIAANIVPTLEDAVNVAKIMLMEGL